MNNEWIDEFYKSLYSDGFPDAEAILEKNIPLSLLKFCNGSYNESGNNVYLDSLRDNKLWLSSPRCFNDPFDCAFNIGSESEINVDEDAFSPEIRRTNIMKQFIEARTRLINLIMPNDDNLVYVGCLADYNNLKSNLMWSHYANCHKGFCIEYDSNSLREKVKTILPVKYQKDIDYFKSDKFCSQDGLTLLIYYSYELCCIKSSEWSNEKEWRIVGEQKASTKPGYYIDTSIPKAVYIGCKASKELRKDLIQICKEKNINLYEMKMKPNSFELITQKVNVENR